MQDTLSPAASQHRLLSNSDRNHWSFLLLASSPKRFGARTSSGVANRHTYTPVGQNLGVKALLTQLPCGPSPELNRTFAELGRGECWPFGKQAHFSPNRNLMSTYYIHPGSNNGYNEEATGEKSGSSWSVTQLAPKMTGRDWPIVLSPETHRLGGTGGVRWR